MSGFDDLFGEAAENASQDSFVDESWGAELKLAENERWAGRYRGEDVTLGFGDERRVHLLEEFDGTPFFIRGRTKLDRQFDKAKPSPGDIVAIVRLDDVAARQRQHDARLRRRREARRAATPTHRRSSRRPPTTSRSSAVLETHRRRDDDQREDAFLEACGAVYGRHRLRVAFTAGLGALREEGAGLEADARARRRASRRRDLRRASADAQRRDPGEGERPRARRVRRPARRARGEVRDHAPAEPGGALPARRARLPAGARRVRCRASSRSPTAASPGRATAC